MASEYGTGQGTAGMVISYRKPLAQGQTGHIFKYGPAQLSILRGVRGVCSVCGVRGVCGVC